MEKRPCNKAVFIPDIEIAGYLIPLPVISHIFYRTVKKPEKQDEEEEELYNVKEGRMHQPLEITKFLLVDRHGEVSEEFEGAQEWIALQMKIS